MNGLKYFSTQEPGHRLPWMGLSEPLDFDLFAQTCAILEADAVGPASALFDALSRPRAQRIVAHWRLFEPGGDEPARFPVLGSRPDA